MSQESSVSRSGGPNDKLSISSKALDDLNLTAVDNSLLGTFLPDSEMFEVPEDVDEFSREFTQSSRRNNPTDLFFLISSDNKAWRCLLCGWSKSRNQKYDASKRKAHVLSMKGVRKCEPQKEVSRDIIKRLRKSSLAQKMASQSKKRKSEASSASKMERAVTVSSPLQEALKTALKDIKSKKRNPMRMKMLLFTSFVEAGLPFNGTQTPIFIHFIRELLKFRPKDDSELEHMVDVITGRIRLDKEERLHALSNKLISLAQGEFAKEAEQQYLTILTDGRKDKHHLKIQNFLLAHERGSLSFPSAIETRPNLEVEFEEFINSSRLKHRIVAISTDGGPGDASAALSVCAKMGLVWSRCQLHAADLVQKKLVDSYQPLAEAFRFAKTKSKIWVQNLLYRQAIIKVAGVAPISTYSGTDQPTRFSQSFLLMERASELFTTGAFRSALDLIDNQTLNTREQGVFNQTGFDLTDQATITNEWNRLSHVVELIRPLHRLKQLFDHSFPVMPWVLWAWKVVLSKSHENSSISNEIKKRMYDETDHRFKRAIYPVHHLAYLFNPFIPLSERQEHLQAIRDENYEDNCFKVFKILFKEEFSFELFQGLLDAVPERNSRTWGTSVSQWWKMRGNSVLGLFPDLQSDPALKSHTKQAIVALQSIVTTTSEAERLHKYYADTQRGRRATTESERSDLLTQTRSSLFYLENRKEVNILTPNVILGWFQLDKYLT